jgi:hypothetical protein
MSQWLRASYRGIQIAASALLALVCVVPPAYSSVIRYDFSGSSFSYILLGGIALPPELSTLTSFRGSFLIDDAIPGAGPPSTAQLFPGAALSIAVSYNTGFSVSGSLGDLSQSRISYPNDTVSSWWLASFESVETDLLSSTLRLVAINFALGDADSGGQDLFLDPNTMLTALPDVQTLDRLTWVEIIFEDASGGAAYVRGHLSELAVSGATVNQPPVASFTYSPENPKVNEEIIFDASDSSDPNGDPLTYLWDFSDGNMAEGRIIKHKFSKPIQYRVRLTVMDTTGLSNLNEKDIKVVCGIINPVEPMPIGMIPCTNKNKGTLLKEVLAESGERVTVWCDNVGGMPAYIMYYSGFCGSESRIVGMCHYSCGVNSVWYIYADNNGNGEPDCFISTGWISKDYGPEDYEPGTRERDGYLDVYEHHFHVADCKTYDIEKEFHYACGPPVNTPAICTNFPDSPCCKNVSICERPEGRLANPIRVTDPILSPESDAYYRQQLLTLQNYSADEIVMLTHAFLPGDLNEDGERNLIDYKMLTNLIGTCRGEERFNSFADADGDGCITELDREILFPNFTLPGDCNGDGQVTIDEIQKCINQFLGIASLEPCCDDNGNGICSIDEVQRIINAFLGI